MPGIEPETPSSVDRHATNGAKMSVHSERRNSVRTIDEQEYHSHDRLNCQLRKDQGSNLGLVVFPERFPQSLHTNAGALPPIQQSSIVLSQTTEDGEIEVRISVGNSTKLLVQSTPNTPEEYLFDSSSPGVCSTPPPLLPQRHAFNRHERQALKQQRDNTSVMTTARTPQTVTPAAPLGSSKSRQKKFHRHFKQVSPDERVLNYYSCALIGDILLQGHLYITNNYFAFYSNVFGYVTKILIPIISVLKISKEKTARIIPNAVGVVTEDEKHVFGTLLSRDSTYRFMVQVWKLALSDNATSIDKVFVGANYSSCPDPVRFTCISGRMEIDTVSADLPPDDDDDDSSLSSEHSCPPTPIETHTSFIHSENLFGFAPDKLPVFGPPVPVTPSRSMLLLLVSTGLLVMLFFSALFLLYRIGRIQDQFTDGPPSSEDVYQDLLKWQTQLHSKSANEVQEFINSNLNQLAKVRQSLEALALLIVSEEKPAPIDNHRSDSDS
uniref:GRAM domain-containing protein n=1 Tax=Timema tahoe TaxID=61484 RepID=A0A7R9FLW2_9NEOP|nr:unnamed protein product [Timema tahoe]